jgi:hypothetical protein
VWVDGVRDGSWGKRLSELERRTPPMRVSGAAMKAAMERAKDVHGPRRAPCADLGGTGGADVEAGPVRDGVEGADAAGSGGVPEDRDGAVRQSTAGNTCLGVPRAHCNVIK